MNLTTLRRKFTAMDHAQLDPVLAVRWPGLVLVLAVVLWQATSLATAAAVVLVLLFAGAILLAYSLDSAGLDEEWPYPKLLTVSWYGGVLCLLVLASELSGWLFTWVLAAATAVVSFALLRWWQAHLMKVEKDRERMPLFWDFWASTTFTCFVVGLVCLIRLIL